jgi:hypothetical protein
MVPFVVVVGVVMCAAAGAAALLAVLEEPRAFSLLGHLLL